MRKITIVNQSSVVSAHDFAAAVDACQRQVNEHFAPAWGGLAAQLVAQQAASLHAPQDVAGEAIYVLDDSDQQGALGYHELTATDSPVGYVFAKTTIEAGDLWQVTLSHELLEQIADPYIDTCVEVQLPQGAPAPGVVGLVGHRRNQTALVAYEVADPVENDTYMIDGVPLSNFVLPAWFQSPATPGVQGPFDYLQKLTAPLTLTAGGYISYATRLGAWQQLSARQSVRPEKYVRHGKNQRRRR